MASRAVAVVPPEQRSQKPNRHNRKWLRACVVQGGKVVDDQCLKKRTQLTLGNGPTNTFVVNDPALPRSHSLLVPNRYGYELLLTEGMFGRLSTDTDDDLLDVSQLNADGKIKKSGNYYRIPLSEHHRGKVVMGETTVLFQFDSAVDERESAALAKEIGGSVLQRLDMRLFYAFMVMLTLELPLLVYMHYVPKPEAVTLESVDDRWAKLLVPERKPQDKKPETKKTADEGPQKVKKEIKEADQKPKEEPKDDVTAAKEKAVKQAAIRKNIAGKGILAVLGTVGEGSAAGAVADVLGEGNIGGDLDSAFDGISGVGLATNSNTRSSRGGGTGEAASIGGLATEGGGKVGLADKKESRISGTVDTEAPEVDGSLDSGAIAKVVQSRMRMVQDCYNRELKRDPSLAGKIEIEFTIGEDGRVESARVSNNKMGSDAVGECIIGRIKSWRFPKPEGGSVTVNFPFIFASSGG